MCDSLIWKKSEKKNSGIIALFCTVFKDYDDLQYGIKQLHSDCMDLFNYFTLLVLNAMIKSSKQAYDQIRERFFLSE